MILDKFKTKGKKEYTVGDSKFELSLLSSKESNDLVARFPDKSITLEIVHKKPDMACCLLSKAIKKIDGLQITDACGIKEPANAVLALEKELNGLDSAVISVLLLCYFRLESETYESYSRDIDFLKSQA